MKLAKFFVVFVTLIGRTCLSKIMIEINKPDGFAELEEAAIKLLTTCYANQDKTIALLGDFPGSFIKRLSADQSFSLVLFDVERRAETNIEHASRLDLNRMHKVDVVVTIGSHYKYLMTMFFAYRLTKYYDSMASVLILGWSPINKNPGCGEKFLTVHFLYYFNVINVLNANLMCRHRTKGITIYSSNPFTKQAPEPWRLVTSMKVRMHIFSYFEREYREHEGMCKNLDFDKTNDVSGLPIEMVFSHIDDLNQDIIDQTKRLFKTDNVCKDIGRRQERFDCHKSFNFLKMFVTYVNATVKPAYVQVHVGEYRHKHIRAIHTRAIPLKQMTTQHTSYAYPHELSCAVLITQFRGNKSQLQKIRSVIDSYSWIGMYMTYVITLIFFKYFLRQPLLAGILNLVRLTCNCGLTTLPPNVAPQIYLSCLLFFVVTMQGIFVGNLAALLTYDIPVRQVNSKQDLADLGYTIYAKETDYTWFNGSVFNGRVILKYSDEDCIPYVQDDPSVACLTVNSVFKSKAVKSNLHLSDNCVIKEYMINVIPWEWAMEERFNKFVGIVISTGIEMTFAMMVDEKRLLEAESEEHPFEPKVMTLGNLAFAFAILGIGLGCAVISFIVEIMIYRFKRRVTTTRVIVLN